MIESGGLFFDGEMWKDPLQLPYNYNPGQMEIKYFWPLTEQIPLDFDYSGCAKPLGIESIPWVPCDVGTGSQVIQMNGTSASWVTATFNGPVETPELVMTLDKEPNFVVKWLYKLLNIKWKHK